MLIVYMVVFGNMANLTRLAVLERFWLLPNILLICIAGQDFLSFILIIKHNKIIILLLFCGIRDQICIHLPFHHPLQPCKFAGQDQSVFTLRFAFPCQLFI